MISRDSLLSHKEDLENEYERCAPILANLRAERKRIERARENIAGALKLVEALLAESSGETT